MSGTFESVREAEAYAREWLADRAEGGPDGSGDRPMYSDEVLTGLEDLNGDVYETLKAMAQNSENVTPDWAMELHADLMWRACVLWLGEERVAELVQQYLRPSPEADMERLIRSVGMGYHPDTPYDGYEPPITQYTRAEWEAVHARFEQDRTDARDLYHFGLDLFKKMKHERLLTYRDGSRSDQVVWEEVRDAVDRWAMYPVETLLETLEWSDAARDAFSEEFKGRYGNED